jgi:hypothetical protein
MSIEQVVNAVDIAIHKLPYMENLYRQAKDQAENMQRMIGRLANDIEERKNKISFLDKIAFTSEQECKRTEQRIRELTAQKDIIEKLIANILNDNKGYYNLKQVTKENVKAILSDNKKLILVSFTAIIQTLKNDPEMANLIYNIPTTNDGEQHKGNNNNITQYLESNNNSILYLTEKNYENLVEALTTNGIDTVSASSNTILSLPQSSFTFQNVSNQNDTYRIEESESFDNSKGDIVE